jgi:hypothetical protein
VDSAEAVVPADGTITLRSSGGSGPNLEPLRPRAAPAAAARRSPAQPRRQCASRAAALVLALVGSAERRSMRRLQRDVCVGTHRAGRAAASAAAWGRPHAGTLARLSAAVAVTAGLLAFTLVHALADAIRAYARFVAEEWRRRRSGSASAGVQSTRK